MHTHIILTVMDGRLAGKKYVFSKHKTCLIGRANDCEIKLPNELEYLAVSRHHCLLELDPPAIRVRDLGSRNGTYVNGLRIGRDMGCELAQDDDVPFTAFDMGNGDTLRVGDTQFWVTVGEQPAGATGQVMTADQKAPLALGEPCLN
jgi:pSer/pThr/pTyr-binding forkhead associated (FHA) protein